MTAIADIHASAAAETHIRAFDVRRDLGAVADLVEICFSDTLDPDGRDYLGRMRSAANNASWTNWINSAEWAAPAMQGYVWMEDGRLVGNASLIPYFLKGRRYFLIANVAVHPEYRRRGIARELTAKAVEHARLRGCPAVWLHVREDNPGAVKLYQGLGFLERARRTTWFSQAEIPPAALPPGYRFSAPPGGSWAYERAWLERSYPDRLSWHMPIKIPALRPGLVGSLYRFLYAITTRQWAVQRDGKLQAALAWQTTAGYANALWLAAPAVIDERVVQALLVKARTELASRRALMIDYPARHFDEAIRGAGFWAHQTLIWMEMPFEK